MIYVKMVIPEIKRKCMAKVCVANTYVSISSQSMAKWIILCSNFLAAQCITFYKPFGSHFSGSGNKGLSISLVA